MNWLRYACLAAVLAAAQADARDASPAGTVVQSFLPANVSTPVTLCDSGASSISAPHYFHFAFAMAAGTSRSYNPVAPPGPGIVDGDTPNLAAGTACQPSASVFTAGVAAGSSDSVVIVSSCYDYRATGGSRTCGNTIGYYTFKTLNPNFAQIPVGGACTVQNGATASVSPSPVRTDDYGKATFTMTAGILTPMPGTTPSATCTFTAQSPANGANASVQIQAASAYDPTIAVASPQLPINHLGTTPIKVQITQAYAQVRIDATCTATQGASLSLDQPNKLTNSSGQATFNVTAQNLAIVDPNVNNAPIANCTFSVHGGTHSVTAAFQTGNACSTAFGLQPPPPACGNP
jgi:hypothetical protein